ncbi:Brp/Blh family beta-carotene 15,15'-dioxygenase [Qipengyuania atrilutea]|uniref:Probable beta-carotene 15,15'-dioxygenase n=1 Tax=Qipengyuania atrilutea TaxID=2744473 RepID=A0A850GZ78_9SPHN|nr:Brp/Blh family beta-carotene 15,15'-dioxygenase [Actirhodobacter atriluteus]NVD44964.1 hypothetical protein [Actirhodobacter atriluteus]
MQRITRIRKAGPWHDAGALLAWAALILAAIAQISGGIAPLVLGLVLFAAGLSHGAGDEQRGLMKRFGLIQAAAYLVVGAAVAGLFLAEPLAGLALFLALSAWHFARSDCAMGPLARGAIAALATGGSALFRPRETTEVFEAVIAHSVPGIFMDLVALAGIAGCVLVVISLVRNERGCGEALIALAATALLSPVLAVGLIFLVGHAIPIQRRQIAAYGQRTVWKAVALPTLIAFAGGAGLAVLTATCRLELELAAALAFGLATPHMLTERLER